MDGEAGGGPGIADGTLTPTERLLLEYLRAGLPDAEIAVRLGISTGEVKQRVERLMWRQGAAGRDASVERLPGEVREAPAAKAPSFERRTWLRRASWFLGGATVATVVIGGLSLLASGETPDVAPSDQVPTSTPAPPAPIIIDDREMLDLGSLFEPPVFGRGFLKVSVREALVGVEGGDTFQVRLDSGVVQWDSAGSTDRHVHLRGNVGERTIGVTLSGATLATRFLVGSSDFIGVYSEDAGNGPALLIEVTGSPAGTLHANLQRDGRFFVSVAPISDDTVLDYWTGELLEVTGARRLRELPPLRPGGFQFTSCEEGRCSVIWQGSVPLIALADGLLTCRPDGILELDAGDFVLLYEQFIMGVGKPEPSRCLAPRTPQVRAGDEIQYSGHYRISAASASGAPLSVGLALSGTTYVGQFAPTVGCPCRRGT